MIHNKSRSPKMLFRLSLPLVIMLVISVVMFNVVHKIFFFCFQNLPRLCIPHIVLFVICKKKKKTGDKYNKLNIYTNNNKVTMPLFFRIKINRLMKKKIVFSSQLYFLYFSLLHKSYFLFWKMFTIYYLVYFNNIHL